METEKVVALVYMGQIKDFPESQVEDALCSGWLRAGDVPDTPDVPRRRGRPARA